MSSIYKNHFEWGWYNRGWKSIIPLVYIEKKPDFSYTKRNFAIWWLGVRIYYVRYSPRKYYFDSY